MKYTDKGIKTYRIINIFFALISIAVFLFWSKIIGFVLLVLSLFFLFRPFSDDEKQDNNFSIEENYTIDEMSQIRNEMGAKDDNFVLIARMISLYYMELNSSKYKSHFKNDIILFTTIGVLDAQIYVFQENTISIKQIRNIAERVLNQGNPLLEFIIEMGVLISKIEEPQFSLTDIKNSWNSKRKIIEQTMNEVLQSYPTNLPEEEIVKGHAGMFLNLPQSKKFREEIGIME